MKTYTFRSGKLFEGMALTSDEKLGQIVLLGEIGRGRHYEKVGLDRKYPPAVIDGVVTQAIAKKITLSAREGGKEISFWVLAKPTEETPVALLRIKTEGLYTRDSRGYWESVEGKPETLVSGYGAYGDAGRIGNWWDGLVVFHPGDVLKVTLSGGSKLEPRAVWMDAAGMLQTSMWRDYETLIAVASVKADAGASGLKILFGQMPAYTWSCGTVQPGIKVEAGTAGPAVKIGDTGRGRRQVEIPLIGISTQETITTAAVAVLREEVVTPRHSWEEPKTKVLYGFTHHVEKEKGFLVRVDASWVYTRGSMPEIAPWQGNPTILCEGQGAHGDAGMIYNYPDVIAVLHEGDVLYVRPEGGRKTKGYSLFVKNGQLLTQMWVDWKIQDAQRDPGFYVAKGTAPMGHVPSDWIGRVVTVQVLHEDRESGQYYEDHETGEVVSHQPLKLNLGWDGRDRHVVEIRRGTWIRLTGNAVKRLEGTELEKRQTLRSRADELMGKLTEAKAQPYFMCADPELQGKVSKLIVTELDTLPTEFSYSHSGDLTQWVEQAEEVVGNLARVEPDLRALSLQVVSGEVKINFGGHYRRMGAANNSDHWVITSEGKLRDPDVLVGRSRYASTEGDKSWRLVGVSELALSWFQTLTGDVIKLPVGGCTPEQLAAVEAIEKELKLSPNAFGLHPQIGGEQAQLVVAIESALARSRSLAKVPEIDFHEVTSPDGLAIAVASVRVPPRATKAMVHGRQGHLIETMPVAGGVVQIISFAKYGGDNLAIRWLSPFDAAVFAALARSDILTCIPQISEEVLRGHRGFLADNSSYLYPEGSLESAIDPQKGFRHSVRSWYDEDVPAQMLERFAGNGGILQILAWDPDRPRLCIRWRDIPAK